VGRERTFARVDVFAARRYGGNPVAVVLDGDGLTDTDIARFARWTNLAETTYVTTPKSEGADFGLRFFPLTVNFCSLDTPRWGRSTRGSNPAENLGTGTSSCSNAV
jgi:PhzF family phenazine biosynthesis protein